MCFIFIDLVGGAGARAPETYGSLDKDDGCIFTKQVLLHDTPHIICLSANAYQTSTASLCYFRKEVALSIDNSYKL